jgi:hypothetical protein
MGIRAWLKKYSGSFSSNNYRHKGEPDENAKAIVSDRHTKPVSARRFFSVIDKSIKKVFNYSIDKIDSVHQCPIEFANIPVIESNDRESRGILLYDTTTGIP